MTPRVGMVASLSSALGGPYGPYLLLERLPVTGASLHTHGFKTRWRVLSLAIGEPVLLKEEMLDGSAGHYEVTWW